MAEVEFVFVRLFTLILQSAFSKLAQFFVWQQGLRIAEFRSIESQVFLVLVAGFIFGHLPPLPITVARPIPSPSR
ncbi:MAG: hypothetical protein DME26_06235 [Verrucomicrobia bacterium]|nr:MAG: hypothetical protein DME26_06235 [Verrucomicrobiota bacterium]